MSPSIRPTCAPQRAQADGEVDGDGALADAALARADGDDVLHLRQHVAFAPAARARACWRSGSSFTLLGAGLRSARRHVRLDHVLQRAGGRRQLDASRRPSSPSTRTSFTMFERDDVLEQLRVLHRPQGGHHLFALNAMRNLLRVKRGEGL